ncbi:MAG: hypothetical protein AB2556_23640 [Candidatus Thiodiazotropha sp.]
MSHDWLQRRADYYEEVLADHRTKEPALNPLKWIFASGQTDYSVRL